MAWDKSKPAGTDLISDIDTLVIANNTALEALLSDVKGWSNLKVTRSSVKAVTVTADQLFLQSTSSLAYRATTVSEAIDITAAGASGLDTGAEAPSTWYYIWIIRKSSDGTINGLISASSTSPTMPADYDQKALVSCVYNSSGSDFVAFVHEGDEYWYSEWVNLATGSPGSQTVWQAIDITAAVPSGLSTMVKGSLYIGNVSAGSLTNDSTVNISSGSNYYRGVRNTISSAGNGTFVCYPFEFNILTTNTIYWAGTGVENNVWCSGFRMNKL